MNWRLSSLDKIQLVSFSDAHSYWPHRIGREVTVFDLKDLAYKGILNAIMTGNGLKETLEFFPEEGKYHWDGHAKYQIQFSPAQTKKNKGLCPVCKKPLTIGVLNRVEELANRPEGFKPDTIGYKSLVPLAEIIADVLGQGKATKKVDAIYQDLIVKGGSEFKILLDLSLVELEKIAPPEIVLGIKNVREGKVEISAGYDGVYGVVKIFKEGEIKKPTQKSLF